jgi:GntR family transcriptional repressor for pyruvate dehydrogenase complex
MSPSRMAEKTSAGPRFTPITSGRAFEEVAIQIRRQLRSGALTTGDRLPPERVLAAHFDISRNTLRQALRALQTSGLVELLPGRGGGAFIRDGGGDAVLVGLSDLSHLGVILPEHLAEARIVLGTAVARFASQRRGPADLAAMEENIALSVQAVRVDDFVERQRLGFEFQRLLAKATRNPVFIVLTNAVIELNRGMAARYGGPGHAAVLPRRRRILASVRAKDGDGAASEMAKFLRMLERFYRKRNEDRVAAEAPR